MQRQETAGAGSVPGRSNSLELLEPLGLFAVTLGVGWALEHGALAGWLGAHAGVAFAALWLYAPILALQLRGRDLGAHGFTLRQSPGAWRALALCLAVLVPYTPLLAAWMRLVDGRGLSPGLPAGFAALVMHQLLAVALPEEAFFRGYLQTRLDGVSPPWRIFRVEITAGIVISSVLFALAHFALRGDPRTLGVFFPGLLFGWLRRQSGSVLLPVLYHALCNVYLFAMVGG
ncbi:MAG: CPBP family intramembrane metalloprotease [Candidatus Wallbacteria bacterium]|nr:CPBP family intramembrane metalloprotease [Candidatus Wallbacteria bacterium]